MEDFQIFNPKKTKENVKEPHPNPKYPNKIPSLDRQLLNCS